MRPSAISPMRDLLRSHNLGTRSAVEHKKHRARGLSHRRSWRGLVRPQPVRTNPRERTRRVSRRAGELKPSNYGRMTIRVLTLGIDPLNAIDQASLRLVDALRERGHECESIAWVAGELARTTEGVDTLVVPYNPFMWGRWGFAPRLVREIITVRFSRARPEIVLIVHEPYVPIHGGKSLVMGMWQRMQLLALLCLADRRFASIEKWALRLSRVRPTGHLPSGSNLPDARSERAAVRAELGLEGALVVATLSTGHPSHLVTYVEIALRRLADEGLEAIFLELGAGASKARVPRRFHTIRPGALPLERLAGLVAAADVLLTPFVDGVSTRRTSFMAGLCEAVAVVGTKGVHTDSMLLRSGLELVEVGSPAVFADRVVSIAADDYRRSLAAAAGRELYGAEFTHEAIAARLMSKNER